MALYQWLYTNGSRIMNAWSWSRPEAETPAQQSKSERENDEIRTLKINGLAELAGMNLAESDRLGTSNLESN